MEHYIAFTTTYQHISNQLISPATVFVTDDSQYEIKALWDTGATNSCISTELSQKMGLKMVSQTVIQTPSGQAAKNTYIINVKLPNNLIIQNLPVADSEIGKQGFDLLIGMDIISNGDFSVSNFQGKTKFTFRFPSVKNVDYVEEQKSIE